MISDLEIQIFILYSVLVVYLAYLTRRLEDEIEKIKELLKCLKK